MRNPGLMLWIDGIDGDCRDPRYPGWMNVLWFSFCGAGEFGQNRPGHTAAVQMFVGPVSTDLQIACLRGDRFRTATLVALNSTSSGERFHGAMKDVRISGFQFQGSSLGRAIHSLEISFFGMELLPASPGPVPSGESPVIRRAGVR